MNFDDEKIEETIEREVTSFGTSAHVNIPKKHIGKIVKIVVFKDQKTETQRALIYGRSLLITNLKNTLANSSEKIEDRKSAKDALLEIIAGNYIFGDESEYDELNIPQPKLDKKYIKDLKKFIDDIKLKSEESD